MMVKSAIGRVRGLGVAHGGARLWLAVRLNSVALVFLFAWFLTSLILLPDRSYGIVRHWLSQPLNAGLMGLLVTACFWHIKYGLQEVIDDYVHSAAGKYACVAVMHAYVLGGAALGLVALIAIIVQAQ